MMPQLALELDSYEESSLYHSTASRGFFSILQRGPERIRQSSHRLDLMPEVLRAIPRDRDSWISQAEFFRPNRRLVNLARIGLSFADLDTYRSNYHGLSPEAQSEALLEHCHQEGVPTPSVITFSGRGLQVKWLYDRPIPAQALPRWNAAQRALCEKLKPFGADPQARDGSRVLRITQTVNTKSGEIVRVVFADLKRRYEFDKFADEVLPFTREQLAQLRAEKQSRRAYYEGLQLIRGGRYGLRAFDPVQLNWDRLYDLRRLAELRGGAAPKGQRDLFMFLAVCFVAWVDPASPKREANTLAQEFAPTMRTAEAIAYAGSAVKRAELAAQGKRFECDGRTIDPRYRWKNSTLLERLQITPAEEKHLKTIVSTAEAKERDRLRKRKFTDRATYEAEAKERRATAADLKAAGLSYRAIAERMGTTINAVDSLLKRAAKEGQS